MRTWLLSLFCVVLSGFSTTWAAVEPLAGAGQQWVLQLGYYANLDNALNFQKQLAEAGFETQIVSVGESGEQRYRVITGRADSPAGLADLRETIREATGHDGFAQKDPFQSDQAREVFAAPQAEYLVAQAGPAQPLDPSPMATVGYDAGLSRTPQETIESMPGFTAGGVQIVPTIGASLGYDDNLTRASANEISSWFYMISPAIRAELPTDRSVLALIAAADIVRYDDSPIDDREHWYLRGQWSWDVSARQDLSLFAQYAEGADARGEGRRQGDAGLIPLEPDEWERVDFGGLWDYGAVGARGRLTLRAGLSELDYTNNEEGILPGDSGTLALDRDWQYYGGTFYWRVAPKTSLLADYMFTDMNYDLSSDSDSEIRTWMLGATWDATARTSGRISYGDQDRDFADPTKEDYSGPAWVASVTWRPRTYSMFTLTGTRNSQEPNGNGDYVLRQDITLSWLHDWAARFGTHVDIGYGEDDYRPTGRTDDLFYWGVGFRYTYNPHLRFGFSINGYDRSSADPEFEYQRMVYLLTLEASF